MMLSRWAIAAGTAETVPIAAGVVDVRVEAVVVVDAGAAADAEGMAATAGPDTSLLNLPGPQPKGCGLFFSMKA